MQIQPVSPALLHSMPKEVLATLCSSIWEFGATRGDNIDEALRLEWAMQFVRGNVSEKPPFDHTVYYSEADERALLNEAN